MVVTIIIIENHTYSSSAYQMQRTSDRIGTLDRMWKEFKDRSMKELKPAMLHFTKIIQNVSPSVKECLDIYANPAPVDKYTGKVS